MHLVPDEMDTIAGAAKALRAGDVTSLSLVERCLARIDACESHIKAWVSVDRDGARQRAQQLDDEGRAGRWRGALHGIPLGIKDIIDMAGLPTGAGSKQMAQSVAARCDPRSQTPQRRRHFFGQDRDDAVCLLRSAADSQSLEHRSHSGRFFERVSRRRGDRHVSGRHRLADRRVDHPSGHLLRCLRLQTVVWPCEPGGDRPAGPELRPSGADCPPCQRFGLVARSDRRTRSRRPAFVNGSSPLPRLVPDGSPNCIAPQAGPAPRVF